MSAVFKCDRCDAIQVPEVSKEGPRAHSHVRLTELNLGLVERRTYDLCQECTNALIPWLYKTEPLA